MPKLTKPLTPSEVGNAKAQAKAYTLHDGGGRAIAPVGEGRGEALVAPSG